MLWVSLAQGGVMGDAASGRNRADYLGEKIRIHEGGKWRRSTQK